MRQSLLYSLVLLSLLACSQSAPKPKALPPTIGQALNGLFNEYWERQAQLFPLEATQEGDNRYNDLLPNDQTAEFRHSLKLFYQEQLEKLSLFDRQALSPNDQISYDLFQYKLSMQLEELSYELWKIPFQQFWGLPLTMGQLGSGQQFQPFKTVQDYENWIGRIKGFTLWTDSAIANFRLGIKSGFVLPKVLVTKMIPQMNELVVKDPTQSLFYEPIKHFPANFSGAQKEKLAEAYAYAIRTELIPSYKKLRDFLQHDYLPKARRSHGLSALPGGKETYAYLVRYWTTTDITPDQIYAIGLSEVKRIRTEMEKIKEQVGFEGTLKEFFVNLRQDPKLMPFKRSEEILQAFRDIHQKIKPHLKSMFGRTPKTPFEIRQTEEFRAASASAEYSQGAADGSRPGIFYIPITDASQFNITSGMESLFLHEAIPGHHYQISLQQENTLLPKFRRFAWYGAFGEGWALYTESLGKELGLYTDPYQYMGALGDEMHRALRLVVDVAIHTKGKTREQAIQYLMDNEPISLEGATAEIERYMAIPAQALSYKMGALKIWELRKRYEQELGPIFKLAAFHDELLKDGVMPLAVVERKMDEWAASLKPLN